MALKTIISVDRLKANKNKGIKKIEKGNLKSFKVFLSIIESDLLNKQAKVGFILLTKLALNVILFKAFLFYS